MKMFVGRVEIPAAIAARVARQFSEQRSQLVEEVVESGNALLESLAFPRLGDDDAGLGGRLEGVAGQDLPVIE